MVAHVIASEMVRWMGSDWWGLVAGVVDSGVVDKDRSVVLVRWRWWRWWHWHFRYNWILVVDCDGDVLSLCFHYRCYDDGLGNHHPFSNCEDFVVRLSDPDSLVRLREYVGSILEL